MANFDIRLTPESKRVISALAKSGKIDLRPTLRVIGIGYRKEVKQIFEREQPRAEGLRWAPLSEKYKAQKDLKYPGKPILVRTGALKSSMTEEGASGNISLISKAGAVFGTSINYGVFHDQGGKKLPKRNFSEPSDRRRDIWIEQIQRDITRNFEKNGIQVTGELFS